MKACILFIFAVAVVALATDEESMKERMKKVHSECTEENAITPYVLCKHVKIGFQNENGDIDRDVMKKSIKKFPGISDDEVTKFMDECGERKGATADEAATALDTCMKKHLHSHLPPREHH